MGCQALMKATQVDGVYDSDPKSNPDATKYNKISYSDILAKKPEGYGCSRNIFGQRK